LELSRATFEKYDPRAPSKVARYAFLHFLLISAAGGAFMSFAEHAAPSSLVAPAIVLLTSVLALGGLIEGRRWALWVDFARQMAGIGVFASFAVERFEAGMGILLTAGLFVILAGLFAFFRPDRALGAERCPPISRG